MSIGDVIDWQWQGCDCEDKVECWTDDNDNDDDVTTCSVVIAVDVVEQQNRASTNDER